MGDNYAEIDLRKYDNQTLIVSEFMSCYMTDMIYNEIYYKVKKLKRNNKIRDVTTAYSEALLLYFNGLKKPKRFKQCVMSIYETFTQEAGYGSMTLSECIDKMTRLFCNDDVYEALTNIQKQALLKTVILNIHAEYIKYIKDGRIHMIVDNRTKSKKDENISTKYDTMIFVDHVFSLQENKCFSLAF